MRFKSRRVKRDFAKLARYTPSLYGLLCWLDGLAASWFSKDLLVTSIFREDTPATVHNLWRGADCRLANHTKDPHLDLTQQEWEELADVANRYWAYGTKANGEPTVCLHIKLYQDKPENDHVHIQVPSAYVTFGREKETPV